MEQNKGFWYADWSFPIFVGLLSSGVFAGTHMYYLYGIGAFNEVAFVAMLKSGIDTGVYGAVAAFGASFLFARIIEGSLVGILDIGGAIQTGIGLGVPALPHSLGLLAKKTVVYTVIAPQGIAWGDETAHLIFLLAISKREYEEAMAIYDIFVTFLRERAMSRLAATRSFDEFKTVAMECVSRF